MATKPFRKRREVFGKRQQFILQNDEGFSTLKHSLMKIELTSTTNFDKIKLTTRSCTGRHFLSLPNLNIFPMHTVNNVHKFCIFRCASR
jgi:hypothetical protein